MTKKVAEIDVVIISDQPTMKFKLVSKDIPIGPGNHPYFKNCENNGFDVRFNLKDPNNLDYRFPNRDADAIWSEIGNGVCPHSGVWDIFKNPQVTGNGKFLRVDNENDAEVEFGFTLNVSKDGDPPYKELDPGGTNQNGNAGMNMSKELLLAIGGAVAGSVLTLGAQALLK